MSQMETSERLHRARDHVWVTERALYVDPTDKWLQMLDLPSRAEAIRRLIEAGLTKKARR
jgi:hypothetical protein